MVTLHSFFGKDIGTHIHDVAHLRLSVFQEFPYLYVGDSQREQDYLKAYTIDDRAMLVLAKDGDKTVAVSTAIPLISPSDIVADAAALFESHGHDPKEYYYYGEIIALPEYRGMGLTTKMYALHEAQAARWGFTSLCLAVVIRPDDHPLKPHDYVSLDKRWTKEGFVKTNMVFQYEWPVLQPNGQAMLQDNDMVYWTKQIAKA